MKKIKYPILAIVAYISFNFMLVGCNKKLPEEKFTVLNEGAYINEEATGSKIFNSKDNGTFEVVDTNESIIAYNNVSATYLYVQDGGLYIKGNNKKIKINEKKIYHQKISPKGDYLFYFTNEEYLTPMIMNLKENKSYSLANKAVISGEFIDWIGENKLAYYGVDNENRITGIFTYDLVSSEEKLIYKIELGYIEFLKSMGDGVFFLQETYGDDVKLKRITSTGEVTEVCNNVEEINDIEVNGEGIFLLGKIKDNTYSLYKIENGEAHRLVFDFPSILNVEKGLTSTLNGDIMFIGSKDSIKDQHIYKYSKGNISRVTKESGDYNFIEMN